MLRKPLGKWGQPLTGTAGAIQVTDNLCMPAEELRRCLAGSRPLPAYDNATTEDKTAEGLPALRDRLRYGCLSNLALSQGAVA